MLLHASPPPKRFSADSRAQPRGAARKGLRSTRRWGFASGFVPPRGDGGGRAGMGGREMRKGRRDPPHSLPCCTFPWGWTWLTSAWSTSGSRNTVWSHQVELVMVKPLPPLSCSLLASAQNQPGKLSVRSPNLCEQPLCSALHPASSACTMGILAQDRASWRWLLRAMTQTSFR